MGHRIGIFLFIALLLSCSKKKETNRDENYEIPTLNLSGEALANIHCSRCHAFVAPKLLSKSSWKDNVLPFMGQRLGIFQTDNERSDLLEDSADSAVIIKANIYPKTPALNKLDWEKIVNYYVTNSPDTIFPPQRSKKIKMGLTHFKYKRGFYALQPPLTVMVKILPENRGVAFSDGKQNVNRLTFLNSALEKEYDIRFKKTPIHYYEKEDTIYLATIGKNILPSDAPDGALQKLYRKGGGKKYNALTAIASGLQRPVYMAYGDLNNDKRQDIVACEFGSTTGKLVWYENMGGEQYSIRPLNNKPGAISAVVKDVNNDGFNDIVALMAQGDEGVFLYENKGDGTFKEKRILTFLPLFGSQYIELADFNNDGFDDLIYVCGDNADKTPHLKSYHGIYIYLNDGNFNFTKSFFYQLNGAYKAMPRDYDLDGDLDIAAISFFPDYASSPEESFVYLENKGNFEFVDYSFPESTNGRWIVMDAADMDADGDIDIALGSFSAFPAQGDTTGLTKKWQSIGPSIIVLENTLR